MNNDTTIDVGVKVMAIPVRILGEVVDPKNPDPILFNQRYGFCFAGSFINAYTFKELIEEILQNIQFTGDPSKLSFVGICECLRRYCGHISTEVCNSIFDKGQYTFFLTGYCPNSRSLEAAQFTFKHEAGKAIANFTKVAEMDSSYAAIGTGADEFQARIKDNISVTQVLNTINAIIDDDKISSVGGDIQYGSFDREAEFKISGFCRKSMETVDINGKQYGPNSLVTYKFRGFTFFDENWRQGHNDYFVLPPFRDLDVPPNKHSTELFKALLTAQMTSPESTK